METPKNKAGQLTEKIMISCFSKFNPNAFMKLSGAEYNRIYERIYGILSEELSEAHDE